MKRKPKRKCNHCRHALVRGTALCLILSGIGTAAFFGGRLLVTEWEYAKGDTAYEELADLLKDGGEPGEILASSAAARQEESGAEAPAEEVPEIDFDAAQQINTDIKAWLSCPDTVIDYPVCQGEDNTYYLTHLADGTYNRNGCLFIDCDNAGDFSDDNTIIYGHHMASGKMFASLTRYASQSYYEEHPVMYLSAEGTQYRMELFSGYVTATDSSAYVLNWTTRQEYADWLREISGRSDFTPEAITLHTSDHIVTLSTCAYDFQNARYVVHGRLVKVED